MWFETKTPPDEEPATPDIYLRYTILNGHGLIGTTVFAVLSAASGIFLNGIAFQITAILIALIAAIIVWLAGYFLWKAEREGKAKLFLDFQIARDHHDSILARTRPKLVGQILQLVSCDWHGRKIIDGPIEHLGSEIKVFLGISSVHPTPVQVLGFRLVLTRKDRTFESIGHPIKDGILNRTDPFKDLVAFLSNESRIIKEGEYFEGQVSFKVEDFFEFTKNPLLNKYKVVITDSYQQEHEIFDWGYCMHTSHKHKQ